MQCPVCLADLSDDSDTCPRCGWVMTAYVVRLEDFDCSQARLPPEEPVYRVMGGTDPRDFLMAGCEVAHSFLRILDRAGSRLQDHSEILDFGAGCGRVLRWLLPDAPSSAWTACDIDASAIEWVRQNLRSAEALVSHTWPPLPFDDGRFDLVLGYSVFTHLPVDHQDAWLEELRRVTRPGGLLLLTVHGPSAYRNASTRSTFHKEHQGAFEQQGFIYWSNDYWKDHFPAYYQTAYHDPSYILRHWTRWLDVVKVMERAAYPNHDVVVARRRL